MAELATIARPYAEALFESAGESAAAFEPQIEGLAALADTPELRQFADNPKVTPAQVQEVLSSVAASQGLVLDAKVAKLLEAVIANGRLAALPEIAAQYLGLVHARTGISDAVIQSAFPIAPAQFGQVLATLEKRFGRKLNASVELVPDLIGGIRVVVGDEVLDTSIKSRLEQMKAALVA
jgi:F-type H+-transporting ATPase subunit delta